MDTDIQDYENEFNNFVDTVQSDALMDMPLDQTEHLSRQAEEHEQIFASFLSMCDDIQVK